MHGGDVLGMIIPEIRWRNGFNIVMETLRIELANVIVSGVSGNELKGL